VIHELTSARTHADVEDLNMPEDQLGRRGGGLGAAGLCGGGQGEALLLHVNR
jgi:hypothetical protein